MLHLVLIIYAIVFTTLAGILSVAAMITDALLTLPFETSKGPRDLLIAAKP